MLCPQGLWCVITKLEGGVSHGIDDGGSRETRKKRAAARGAGRLLRAHCELVRPLCYGADERDLFYLDGSDGNEGRPPCLFGRERKTSVVRCEDPFPGEASSAVY